MTAPLVLSLFPCIGLLDMAFEAEGFCVVRGPDLLWGGDIKRFHVPRGRFDGVIGGSPCQIFGGLANFAHRWKRQPENLVPEFVRVVEESGADWYAHENVPLAQLPAVYGYELADRIVNARQFGLEQDRERRIAFGVYSSNPLGTADSMARGLAASFVAPPSTSARTLTSAHAGSRQRMKGRIEPVSVERALELQGLPSDFFQHDSPLTAQGKKKLLAQGVPLPMGRAIAKAVKRAMYPELCEISA